MKTTLKLLLLGLLLSFVSPSLFAQTSVTGQIMEGVAAVRPASCSSGDIFFAQDTYVLYQCGPTNTWTTVAVSITTFAGTPTGSCTSNQLAVNTLNGYLYTCLSLSWNLVNAIVIQVNGINAGSQVKLNFVSGSGISITDNGSGNITISASNIPWVSLTSFPSPCSTGQYVSAVGTTLTCSSPSGTTSSNNTWTGTNTFNGSVTGVHPPCNTVSFTASLIISANFDTCTEMTLTGNVTSITITGTPTNHTQLFLYVPQDSVGNRSISWPSNFHFPTGWTLQTAANGTNYLGWAYDGTYWQPLVAFGGGSSSGGSPAGANGAVQIQQGGSFGATGNLFDFGNYFAINEDASFKQNPFTDCRNFNCRAVTINTIPKANTASCNGTNQITLSGIINGGFNNGDGISVPGCGAAVTVPTPTITSISPVNPTDDLNTNHVVTNSAGSSTICMSVSLIDTNYGFTAASAPLCTSQAQASLGQQTATITSCSRSNALVTCTGTGFGFAAGTRVFISGTSDDTAFAGFPIVSSASGTSFSYTSPLDSRSGANTSSTGGTVYWENGVQVVLNSAPGGNAFIYAVYETSPVAQFLGFTFPVGLENGYNDPSYETFTYYGSTLSPNFVPPTWFPTTPPVAAQNGILSTTIVSGASGTTNTTVTVATSAGNTFSSTAFFDDGPNIAATDNYVKNTGGGFVYIPVAGTNSYYPIQSFTSVSSNIEVGAYLFLTGTLKTSGKLIGAPVTPCSSPSFSLSCYPQIVNFSAYPGIWTTSGQISQLSLSNSGNVYLGVLDTSMSSFYYNGVNFSGGANSDCMGLLYLGWGSSGGNFGGVMNNVSEITGPNPQVTGGCSSLSMWFRNMTEVNIYEISMARRGIGIQVPDFGIQAVINQGQESQGGIVPEVTILRNRSGNANGSIRVATEYPDTQAVANIANWTGVGGFNGSVYLENSGSPASNIALISGKAFSSVHMLGVATTSIGQNVNINTDNDTSKILTIDGTFSTNATGVNLSPTKQHKPFVLSPGFQIFSDIIKPSAPTCTTTSGGTISVGTHTLDYHPMYPNGTASGGEGKSSYSCTFTTTSGNQSVQISGVSAPGAPTGYNIYLDGFLVNINSCVLPQLSTTAFPYTFSGGGCGYSEPNSSGTGVAGINGPTVFTYSGLVNGYQDYLNTTAGGIGNPASGYCRNYYDTSSGTMKAINSSGSSCGGSSSGLWNGIGNPTGNMSLTMYSGNTNYSSAFHFTGSGSLSNMFGWLNDTSATSGLSQASPQLYLCGNAWHSGASVQSCLNIQIIPGNGADANGNINFSRTGTDTGSYQSNFPGPVASGASGSGVGGLAIFPEGTAPSSLCTSGQDNIYADITSHHLYVCFNNGGSRSSTTSPANTTSGNVPSYSSNIGDLGTGYGVQGTDNNLLTAGNMAGATGSTICKDGNGGATTVGCSGGGGGGGVSSFVPSNIFNPTRYEQVEGFYSTAAVTVANTGSSTSLISTPNGFQLIPNNTMLPLGTGFKTFDYSANGVISTLGSSPGNISVAIILGGVTIDTITLSSANVPTSLSSASWDLDYKISVTSNSTATGGGCLEIINASNASIRACSSVSNATGLNFLSDQIPDLKWTWATPSSSNSVTARVVKGIPLQRF